MASGGNIELGKAFITIVPTMEGSQAEITKELTGITTPAAQDAGKESGSTFGNNLAEGIKLASATIAAAVTAATAAAVAVGKEFIEAANATAAYGDEVDKMSQKLGFSASSYQALDYALKINGTEMASMSAGMKTLTNKIADAANGSSEAAAMFEGLGVSMEDLQNLSTEELFIKTVKGLQNMEEGAERSALANDLFGKSGQNLAPLLNSTNEEFDTLIQNAYDYGMVMDDEAVKASADYTDALTTMQGTFKGLTNSLMSQFLPSLTTVMDGLTAIFSGDEGGIAMIQEGITGLIDNISAVSPQLFELVTVIVNALIAGFGPMLPQVVSAIFNFLNQAILTISGMIPQLVPAITEGIKGICSALLDSLPIIITALIGLVKDLVIWLSSDNNVKTLIDGILNLVSILAVGLSDALPILLPALVDIIAQLAASITDPANVQMILNSVLYIVGAVVMALVAALPNIGGVIVTYITNIIANIQYFGSILVGWLTPFIDGIKNTFTNWLSNIQTTFSDVWNNITNGVSNIIGTIQGLVNDIISTLANLPNEVISIGENIVNGLIGGVQNKNGSIISAMQNLATNAVNAAKDKLKIKSPSRVFMELGGYTAEGFGIGFDNTMADVEKDMADTFGGLTGNMSAEISANGTDSAAMVGTSNTVNGGNISINVYGAEGQDVNALAEVIAYKLEDLTKRRSAVYG